MKSFIATCALVSFAQAVQVEQTAIKDFASWMATYNVSYATTTEKSTRQTNWNNNFKVIESLNKTKGHTFTVGPNIMADRTAAEVTKIVGPTKAANKFKS